MPTFGPDRARVEVLVFREGLLSSVAHDLLLRATSFEIAVDPVAASVAAQVDAASLRVITALRDGQPLPEALRPADVREIEGTVAQIVLRAREHPAIRFTSGEVTLRDDGLDVRGRLTLCGATRPIELAARRRADRLDAEVRLDQRAFGIRPYRAMLGALRVQAEVVVRASLPAQDAW